MENNNLEKEYWGKSFYGSKLNTVLLVVLIILMVFAIKIMLKNEKVYFPFSNQNISTQQIKPLDQSKKINTLTAPFKPSKDELKNNIQNNTYLKEIDISRIFTDMRESKFGVMDRFSFNAGVNFATVVEKKDKYITLWCGDKNPCLFIMESSPTIDSNDFAPYFIGSWPSGETLQKYPEFFNENVISNTYQKGSLDMPTIQYPIRLSFSSQYVTNECGTRIQHWIIYTETGEAVLENQESLKIGDCEED